MIDLGSLPLFADVALSRFSPLQWGALVAWYEANYGVALNGSAVSAWAPKYGTGPTLTQATAAKQPLFIPDRGDFRPEILWDGVDDCLLGTLATALPSVAHTLVLVGRLASTVASGRIVQIDVGGDSLNQALYLASTYSTAAVIEPGVRSAGAWATPGATTVPGAAASRFALVLKRDASSWTVVAKGVTQAGTLSTAVANATTLNVGQGSGVYFGGSLSALGIYSTAVTDPAALLAAVMAQWPTVG